MSHAPEHDRWLDALLAGEVDEGAPEVRAVLESCATCAREWEEMRSLLRSLDRTALRAREARRWLAEGRSVPGALAAEAALREEIARTRPPSVTAEREPGGARARGLRWPLALAAAALILVFGLWMLREDVPSPPRLLGSRSVTAEALARTPEGGYRLRWSGEVTPGARVYARIEGRPAEVAPWRAVDRREILGPELVLPAALIESWPRELRWRVVVLDVLGATLAESDWSPSARSP